MLSTLQTAFRTCLPAARHFGGGPKPHWTSPGEEYYIRQALRWMLKHKPIITMQVEKAPFVGFNQFLPDVAAHTLQRSLIRIKCITHADLISERALSHQIMIAEQQADGSPIAVVALDLSDKETTGKQVRQLEKLIMGATEEARDRQVLVCGIPNSGKSSLILPLTRARTLLHRKKQHYHLPKVSAAAGRTLGLKKHHLELPWKQLIALIDSPGLRPRLEDFKRYPETLAMLLAVRAIEPYKGYREDVGDRILRKMLGALNRHAIISETVPDYVEKLNLSGPIDDAQAFLYAARRSFNRATLRDSDLVAICQRGELGGIIFGDGPIMTGIPQLKYKRQPNSAVVYMNEEAQRLYKIGAALTPTSRG